MAIRVHGLEGHPQVLTPVRFTRAIRGRAQLDAPDPDDRGWEMPRPPGWNESEARGVMIGIMVGDTVRLRVEREDVEASTPLFVTASSGGAPQFRIADPDGGGALGADGVFRVEALEDNDTPQTIEVRIGAIDGPIVAEAEPHVFEPRTLRIAPHLCTIHGGSGSSGTTPALDLAKVIAGARAILRPAGIVLRADPLTRIDYSGFNRDDVPRRPSSTFSGNEEAAIVRQGYAANRCNVWLVRYMEDSGGVGVPRETMSSEGFGNPGILLATDGSWNATGGVAARDPATREQQLINDLAHELGHFLTLSHADAKDAGRNDSYTLRNLMHPMNPTGQREDTGYGPEQRGCLLTLKRYPNYENDGQVARMRDRLRQPNSTKY